jgi:hypothetical protein
MSEARVFKIENRLAKVISLPGGKTASDALRGADMRIASVRDDCLASMGAKAAKLQHLADQARRQTDEAAVAGIYATANEVFSIASAFDMTELAEAAYGLCDLVDDSRARTALNWPAIGVHIDGIRFLSAQAGAEDSPARRAIVAGLREVAARFAGDAA